LTALGARGAQRSTPWPRNTRLPPSEARRGRQAPAKPSLRSPAKPDTWFNAGRGQQFTAVCAACHGADGNSGIPANPKLAQQHPEYIIKQLQEFKAGKRKNPIMQGHRGRTLSDDDMRNIAYYVTASKKAKPGFAKDKAPGRASARRSTAAALPTASMPACAGCHSPTGAGIARPSTRAWAASMPTTPWPS
jgi:cytochrome c553